MKMSSTPGHCPAQPLSRLLPLRCDPPALRPGGCQFCLIATTPPPHDPSYATTDKHRDGNEMKEGTTEPEQHHMAAPNLCLFPKTTALRLHALMTPSKAKPDYIVLIYKFKALMLVLGSLTPPPCDCLVLPSDLKSLQDTVGVDTFATLLCHRTLLLTS